MSDNNNDLGYSGPEKEYRPQIGSNLGLPVNELNTFDDRIYNYETLVTQLDQIIKDTNLVETLSEEELNKFTLKITTDKLSEAQSSIWPQSIPDVKDYVTYNEYKALGTRLDRASKYIKDEYTKNIRGEQGSGVFDIQRIAKVVNAEAKNIKGFLNANSISDISDSAQKRIAELFQDWSTSALSHSKRLLSFFSERGKENTSKVPESEVASITEQDAGRYQALFKARINAVNLELDREMSNFERHFLTSSDIFYSKFLGPAVKFHKGAGSELIYKTDQTTMLGREVIKANESVGVNMTTALADLIQRNEIFETKILSLESSIGRRESLKQVFQQFAIKNGRGPSIFLDSVPDKKLDLNLSQAIVSASASLKTSNLTSSHNTLSNRDDPNAHPQYILKSGDKITGNIEVADGVKIDGVDVSAHNHSGLDGSQKIGGHSILPNSLPASAIDIDQFIQKPTNLRLVGYSDGGKIGETAIVNANFFWESEDPNQMYEIQITKRDSATFDE